VRNIVFRSPDPKKGVDTWIRLQDGETRARVTLDDTYWHCDYWTLEIPKLFSCLVKPPTQPLQYICFLF